MDSASNPRRKSGWLVAGIALAVGATAIYCFFNRAATGEPVASGLQREETYGSPLQIQYFCGQCHPYPPAHVLPRSAWKEEVEQAYRFFEQAKLPTKAPPIEQVIHHFESQAPLELPLPRIDRASQPMPVSFASQAFAAPNEPAIANVNLVHLFDDRRLDVLACDMQAGLVMALSPYAANPTWRVLAHVPNPAHAEVVDLDGDGVKDILVANLGSVEPTDDRCGSVVWLRGNRDGSFTPITLLENVGRVADVQAADFRGVGKLDLIVAVFGWRTTGEVIYLENQTTDPSKPIFVPHVLDDRHGAIHVPVGDIDGDGRPDFVALISQEHETIVAFLNNGNGQFRKETIYQGPHPAFGSTGIQLVDLDGDGKLDVLYTNGDSMGKPHVLKPYHGVHWLQNLGTYPFKHQPIATMCGVHRAVAADFRGNGKLDVVAVSLLPGKAYPQREVSDLDSVIYLEQTSPGKFVRHALETRTCDHASCVAGDIFSVAGKIDLVTGNLGGGGSAITIWKNNKAAPRFAPAEQLPAFPRSSADAKR